MVRFQSLFTLLVAVSRSVVLTLDLSYEYVVVGGGTGGGTLAVELAKKGYKTLLLEAGPQSYSTLQSTPFFHAASSEDPNISFDYQVQRFEGSEVRHFYPRVGGLGGCSIHNALVTMYPNTRDFDLMADITKDLGWKEPNMRKYFKRLEKNQFLHQVDGKDHGTNGFYSVSYLNYTNHFNLTKPLSSFVNKVVPEKFVDVNGYTDGKLSVDSEGKVFIPVAIDQTNYQRVNFPKYILDATRKFPLTISTDTLVTKVLFDRYKTAIGVEFRKGKHLYKASPLATEQNRNQSTLGKVFANREVILSAGVFNTPQLLLLSGIGDAQHLQQHNIKVISDLVGVGKNLMDRYEIPISIKLPKPIDLLQDCTFTGDTKDPCWNQYQNNFQGIYKNNGLISGQLKKSHFNLTEPDLFIINLLGDFHGYFKNYSQNFAQHPDILTRLILKAHTSNTLGTIQLKSKDPFETPQIQFNYFKDSKLDYNILKEELKIQRNDLNQFEEIHQEYYPGEQVDEETGINSYLNNITWGHHASCSAKVGKDDDRYAVLDAQFKVRGVQNLRVVDASALPKIPGYFPVLYIHLIALRLADIITKTS